MADNKSDYKEPQYCWEYWNCLEEVRDKCVAYTSASGKECWMIVGSNVVEFDQCPKLKNEFKDCWECPWFQMMNPDFSWKK